MDSEANRAVADGRRRLIIVEDEEPIAKLFALILGTTYPSLEIVETMDAEEALAVIGQQRPDLVMTDVNLPGMCGITLFREIERVCTENSWDMPPVIFCTGDSHTLEVREIVSDNPTHCILAKPVTRDSLIGVVEPRLNGDVAAPGAAT